MTNIVKLGLIQTAAAASPAANLNQTLTLVERAAQSGAQIICTQELFRSQYFCQSEDYENFKLAKKIPGPTTAACCRWKYQVVIIASLFERRAPRRLSQYRRHH
jgi:N-carbamoylputrescine amidase